MERINIIDDDLDEIDRSHKWREYARFTNSVYLVCTTCRARMFKQRVLKEEDTFRVEKYEPHFICNEMIVHKTMED